MPEEIVLQPNAILAWCGFITAIGIAFGWLAKATRPLVKPIKEMRKNIDDIEEQQSACAKKFENDQERLDAQDKLLDRVEQDIKVLLESQVLLMKHAETGNCTGEVAEGRSKLESYLIHR